MIRLGINIDHVAAIRQARGTDYPDILEAAQIAKSGGADQITVHLREDRRHIQDADLEILKTNIRIPLNLEMAATPEITRIAADIKPFSATIVPERRQEQTTERGLDLEKEFRPVEVSIRHLKMAQITVSLFIDPNTWDVKRAKELGADTVELHTGAYSMATTALSKELERLKIAALLAKNMGLKLAAGHGLNYKNTKMLIQAVPEIEELNIGHSIIARAIFVGLDKAVSEMKEHLSNL